MALTKCHECGQDVSTQAKACPTCGAKVKKPSGTRSILFLLAVLGVLSFLILATKNQQIQSPSSTRGQSDAASDGPAVSKPISPAEQQRQSEHEVKKSVQLKYDWTTSGFGTVMMAAVTIINPTPHSIKDIKIECDTFGSSGTKIGSLNQTVYESIKPKSKKTVKGINMGFIHSQTHTIGCIISNLVVVPTPEPRGK